MSLLTSVIPKLNTSIGRCTKITYTKFKHMPFKRKLLIYPNPKIKLVTLIYIFIFLANNGESSEQESTSESEDEISIGKKKTGKMRDSGTNSKIVILLNLADWKISNRIFSYI